MRCPSCGTENEPDSRFCGGCGARLAQTDSRIAPTQKIDTGARPVAYPPTPAPSAPYPLTPSVQRNPSKPQDAAAPTVSPNGAQPARARAASEVQPYTQQRPRQPSHPAPDVSVGLPPRRRTGLIAAVLIVDLALAAAGGWMLAKGLASPAEPAETTGSASSAVPEPSPAAAVIPIPVAPPADAAPLAAPDAAIASAPTPEPDAREKRKTSARTPTKKKSSKKKQQQAPVDPYGDPMPPDEDPSDDAFPPDLPPPPPEPFP